MISVALSVLLAVAALIAVAYPVVRRRPGPAVDSARESLAELQGQRDAAFQALRELQFDHAVGKVADEDFGVFEANLKIVAAESLRQLDRWESETGSDFSLDDQIAARKAALLRSDRLCPQCGRPAAAEDRFCAACGTEIGDPVPALQATGTHCPQCGAPAQPEDRFCAACGSALPTRMDGPAR